MAVLHTCLITSRDHARRVIFRETGQRFLSRLSHHVGQD